ncbi:hypothetical protein [Aneurinibacillus sp. UBA3580]|uniref:hypothetical protein n=1 Tax=Aneurinibacillus sp. UBA3580 TaxID=1946041 RepID=UPI00257F69A7|nr:hypothetical protein [Aneurinibacillus sp. UBA3580]
MAQKKNLASETTRAKRIEMVEWEHPELPIKTQAEWLSLNRSSLYYRLTIEEYRDKTKLKKAKK